MHVRCDISGTYETKKSQYHYGVLYPVCIRSGEADSQYYWLLRFFVANEHVRQFMHDIHPALSLFATSFTVIVPDIMTRTAGSICLTPRIVLPRKLPRIFKACPPLVACSFIKA